MPFTRRLLLALALLAAASAAPADDLTTTGGKKLTGKLVAINAEGATFLAGDARVVVPGKEIILINLGKDVAAVPKDTRVNEIELTDGSTFRAGKFYVKGRKVEAELATVPAGLTPPGFELPLGSVFSIMRGAEDPKNRTPWQKVLSGRGKRDLYVVREPEGLNFVQGTVLGGDEAGTRLNFEKEDGTKDVLLLSRATGGLILSQPAPAQLPPTLCKVIDVFGNSLVAKSVELSGDATTVTTVSGVVVRYTAPGSIAKFDYARGNIAYLSDIEAQIDAPPVPPEEKGLRLNVTAPVLRDQGVAGDPLKLGGDTFSKGLVVAADAVLTFHIGGDYRELKAVVGIPETTPDATVQAKLTIAADDRIVFSETLRRKDRPKPVTLDVKGVKQLRLLVESDGPVVGNRVLLGDARVEK